MRGDITSIGASADHATQSQCPGRLCSVSSPHVNHAPPGAVASFPTRKKPPKDITYTKLGYVSRTLVGMRSRNVLQVSSESNHVTKGQMVQVPQMYSYTVFGSAFVQRETTRAVSLYIRKTQSNCVLGIRIVAQITVANPRSYRDLSSKQLTCKNSLITILDIGGAQFLIVFVVSFPRCLYNRHVLTNAVL